jgi:hypothetical protein
MGMLANVDDAASADLEAPDVIAQIAARDQTGLGQVDEVTIDRRSIEAQGGYFSRNLAMAEGACRTLEELEYRNPSGRFPETRAAQKEGVLALPASRRSHEPRFGPAPCHSLDFTAMPAAFQRRPGAERRRGAIATRLRHDATWVRS